MSSSIEANNESEEEETVPLLTGRRKHGRKRPYSVIRARVISVLVPLFAMSAASARDPLLAQYIVTRLADAEGYDYNHTQFNPCDKNKNDSDRKMADKLEAEASELLTYYSYLQCIPAFFTCLMIGSYSDFLGRRLLLLVPVFSNLAKMAMIMFIIKFDLNLNMMYLAYGFDGVCGSWFVILVALYALTADISDTKADRAFWIYFLTVAAYIVSAGANIASGRLIKALGFFYASLLLTIMTAMSFIIPLFFMPETIQRPGKIIYNPFIHIRRIFGFYFFDGSLRKRGTFCVCLMIFLFGVANDLNVSSVDALYLQHEPFCWNSESIGYYMAMRTAGSGTAGTLLLQGLKQCIPIERIGAVGMLFQAAAYIYEAFLNHPWQVYLVPVILIPSMPAVSIMRTMMSVLAEPNQQGALFSSIAVVETLCNLVTTTTVNRIFAATVDTMPGLVYLIMGSFSLISFTLFLVYFYIHVEPHTVDLKVEVSEDETQPTNENETTGGSINYS